MRHSQPLWTACSKLVLLAFTGELQSTVGVREIEENVRGAWCKSSCKVLLLACDTRPYCYLLGQSDCRFPFPPPSVSRCWEATPWFSWELFLFVCLFVCFLRLVFNRIVHLIWPNPLGSWARLSSEAKEAIGVSGWSFGVRWESLQWA